MLLLQLKSWVLPLLAFLAIAGAVLPAAAFRSVAAAPLDAKAQLQVDRTTTAAPDAAPAQRRGFQLNSKALAHRAAPELASLDFSLRPTGDLGADLIALRGAATCNCCKSEYWQPCCDPGINCCKDCPPMVAERAPLLLALDKKSPRTTEDLGASSIALRGAQTCNCCRTSNEPMVCCDPGINCCKDCPPMVAERAALLLALAKKSPRQQDSASSVNARDDTSMATEARDEKAAHGPTTRNLDGKAAGTQAQARFTEEEEAPLQQRDVPDGGSV